MRKLIERLRAEKKTIELKESEYLKYHSGGNKEAYCAGQQIARKWINVASYQEIKDAIKRPNSKHDTNYFSLMRSVYFASLEKIFPEESLKFKWNYSDAFVNGWREEVNKIWESIEDDVNR
jgi:hypothetical protein